MNASLSWAIKRTSIELSTDIKKVEAVYKSYWKFMKSHIAEKKLSELSMEEFLSSDTNFNIPQIGKLYADYKKIKRYNKKLKQYKNAKNQKD